jgi:RNA 2',3'-cyclic 3'-phosphodiesterase
MPKLFFALLPDDNTRQELQLISSSLALNSRQRICAELWHITLVFIGHVDKTLAAKITEAAMSINSPVFTLVFDQLEYWRKAGIVCLTCSQLEPLINTLVTQLSTPLIELGVKLDTRPYRAHLTLARHCQEQPTAEFKPITWSASQFVLMESLNDVSGVFYRTLQGWQLASIAQSDMNPLSKESSMSCEEATLIKDYL